MNEEAVETVKFSDGSTVNFDANGQKNGPKFYTKTKGVRVYANNKLIFKGIKKIKQIVMTCDSYNGTNYVAMPQPPSSSQAPQSPTPTSLQRQQAVVYSFA